MKKESKIIKELKRVHRKMLRMDDQNHKKGNGTLWTWREAMVYFLMELKIK